MMVDMLLIDVYRGFGKCNALWSIALPLGFQHNGYSYNIPICIYQNLDNLFYCGEFTTTFITYIL